MTDMLTPFPGGLVLAGHKEQSMQTAIRKTPLSSKLILPLKQHIGDVSVPIVNVGDHVLKGQKIARADGHVSVYLHAPSSGTIVAIDTQPVPHPSGLSAPCITIETDGKDEWITREPISDITAYSDHAIRQRIREAGIVGLGGAGFPSFIKLNPGIHHFAETLIINGIECEPYITCDDILMCERAEGILDGIAVIQYAVKAKQCIIAIEDNKQDAISAMQQALSAHSGLPNTKIVVVPTRYPAGSEKQLIQAITGKQVPSNSLPIELGIICHNIGTSYAIGRAIKYGEPLISRIVTVSGADAKHAGNFETLFGTPVHELFALANVKRDANQPFIVGGPMMGYRLSGDHLPITKTANCILVGTGDTQSKDVLPCIRCGECATVCPVSLLPQQLYWHAHAKEFDKIHHYNLFDCIECGCCSYVCPSNIPLVHYFRFAKTEIMHQQTEQEKSDHARIRHDNRQERQAREKQEKEERQRQRKAALAASKAAKEKEQLAPTIKQENS